MTVAHFGSTNNHLRWAQCGLSRLELLFPWIPQMIFNTVMYVSPPKLRRIVTVISIPSPEMCSRTILSTVLTPLHCRRNQTFYNSCKIILLFTDPMHCVCHMSTHLLL